MTQQKDNCFSRASLLKKILIKSLLSGRGALNIKKVDINWAARNGNTERR